MACGLEVKTKKEAVEVAGMYLDCAPFVSIAGKEGHYKLYPRVKDKQAFAQCVKSRAPINDEWLKGE
jgi:hypothetical protein